MDSEHDSTTAPSQEELRMDVDSGLRFVHVMGMRTKADVIDAQSRVLALVEEFVANGMLDMRSFDERRERIKQREMTRGDDVIVQMAPPVDKYAAKDLPKLDCVALHPICHGRCCKLNFPLTAQDLDERVIEWDYSKPYMIRKREDNNRCVHQDVRTHQCQPYQNRPAICRTYDCRNDKRIWSDFEKRIPAPDLEDETIPASGLAKAVSQNRTP